MKKDSKQIKLDMENPEDKIAQTKHGPRKLSREEANIRCGKCESRCFAWKCNYQQSKGKRMGTAAITNILYCPKQQDERQQLMQDAQDRARDAMADDKTQQVMRDVTVGNQREALSKVFVLKPDATEGAQRRLAQGMLALLSLICHTDGVFIRRDGDNVFRVATLEPGQDHLFQHAKGPMLSTTIIEADISHNLVTVQQGMSPDRTTNKT